jgi:quercetin dioxygenase-like cupin family protein
MSEGEMNHFTHYANHTGSNPDKQFKATLFESDRLMLGLNCLEPGQTQHAHTHDGQDKFYFVVEGEGAFEVGEAQQTAGPGGVVWAPAGAPHAVKNQGTARLVLLVGIAPWK